MFIINNRSIKQNYILLIQITIFLLALISCSDRAPTNLVNVTAKVETVKPTIIIPTKQTIETNKDKVNERKIEHVGDFHGINRVKISNDLQRVGIATDSGIFVYDLNSLSLLWNNLNSTEVTDIEFTPSGNQLIVSTQNVNKQNWNIYMLDAKSGNILLEFSDDKIKGMYPISINSAADKLASGSPNVDADIVVWNAESGEIENTFITTKGVGCLTFSPDGMYLAACADNLSKIWKTENWQEITNENSAQYFRAADDVNDIAISSNGLLAYDIHTKNNNRVYLLKDLWLASTMNEIYNVENNAIIENIEFSNNSSQLAITYYNEIVLTDILSGVTTQSYKVTFGEIEDIMFIDTNRLILVTRSGSTITILELQQVNDELIEFNQK